MTEKKLADLTDQELLQEAKKMKSAATINAVLIGVLIGVVIYGVVINSMGFLVVIPLFLIYKLSKKSDYNTAEIENQLKDRNLK